MLQPLVPRHLDHASIRCEISFQNHQPARRLDGRVDVMDHLLSGTPIGRIAGADAMKFAAWQRLNAEYAKQFGIETPDWPGKGPEAR